MSYVPTWGIFARPGITIAEVVWRSNGFVIMTNLWINSGAFGRTHRGKPWNGYVL
jgi:hypothetical protein